jgi:hypothetical protein
MENELHRQIEVKRREQHLATRGFIQKAVERQNRVGGDSKHMDIIYGIADRNRREYEYEIDCLKDKIKLLHETDPSKIFEIKNGTRLKTAYFKLTADYTSTPHDINRHVYEHTRLPNGELQMGLFQRVKNHMKDEILSAYELDNIQNLYMRLLYLYYLDSRELDKCKYDFYNLALTLPKTGNIGEFIDRYVEAYLIPQKLNRFALRTKLLRQLPLCDDVICEIFSFLNDDGICSRRMIDTRVYA